MDLAGDTPRSGHPSSARQRHDRGVARRPGRGGWSELRGVQGLPGAARPRRAPSAARDRLAGGTLGIPRRRTSRRAAMVDLRDRIARRFRWTAALEGASRQARRLRRGVRTEAGIVLQDQRDHHLASVRSAPAAVAAVLVQTGGLIGGPGGCRRQSSQPGRDARSGSGGGPRLPARARPRALHGRRLLPQQGAAHQPGSGSQPGRVDLADRRRLPLSAECSLDGALARTSDIVARVLREEAPDGDGDGRGPRRRRGPCRRVPGAGHADAR